MMLNMSQEKLGDALGLTFQQVQKYEKGTNRIGASRLQQIANALQVPVASFFEGAPDAAANAETQPTYVNEFLATSSGLAVARSWWRISPALQRQIVDLVQAMANEPKQSLRQAA
jgi:transcriptional regulator with XRE-family HTH domain